MNSYKSLSKKDVAPSPSPRGFVRLARRAARLGALSHILKTTAEPADYKRRPGHLSSGASLL
ncbi:hypothetical protein FACS189492_1770 [Clostridia bacterium]|nr:hypothetical protein FACS189492_1770 [Clostridia bacterium]